MRNKRDGERDGFIVGKRLTKKPAGLYKDHVLLSRVIGNRLNLRFLKIFMWVCTSTCVPESVMRGTEAKR